MKCVNCGSTEKLTVDHIIPKWLYKKFDIFGLKKNLGKSNIQILCSQCNNEKGGLPDFSHPIAQELADKLKQMLN